MTSDPASNVVTPTVAVSLVMYNGMRWLPGCLQSLRAQTLRPAEIFVVDNASTDGTLEWLRAEAQRDQGMQLYESSENLGFAKAHNRNIFQARGDFVCLLNQDVELDERFLEEAVAAFHERPNVAAVQGRLRRLGADGARLSVLDSTGLVMLRDRRVVSRGQGEQDRPAYSTPGPVWGADGPAPIYRRAALLDARLPATARGWEVLDEDFFMYKEDVDLAWRLKLLGWEAWYQPSALGWHARGTKGHDGISLLATARRNISAPHWIAVLSWRNQRLMQLKNDHVRNIVRDLPWVARREALSFLFLLVPSPRRARALSDLFRLSPAALYKRRHLHRRLRRHIPRHWPQSPRRADG